MSNLDEHPNTKDEGRGIRSPQGFHTNPTESNMDRYLTNKASAFRYPPTPDIASAVRNRLVEGSYRDNGRPRGRRHRPAQAGLAMALTVAVLLGSMFVVPGARAFVGDLYVGAVHLILGGPDQPQRDISASTPVIPGASWNPGLAGETNLASIAGNWPGALKLPTYPSDLGLPDHIYYQSVNYDLFLYVWLDPTNPARPRLTLYQVPMTTAASKIIPSGTRMTDVMVGTSYGEWIDGPTTLQLQYYDANGSKIWSADQLLDGNTLLWKDMDNGYTYKLVGDLTQDEAIRIATSMEPLSAPPTPRPTATPISPASRLDLTGETGLYGLTQHTGFRVKIPALVEMPELIQPDKVYLQGNPSLPDSAQMVVMAWFVPDRPDALRMLLTQGMWDVSYDYDTTTGAVTTAVHGNPAKWVQTPQKVYVDGPDGTPTLADRRLITNGHALIWQEDGLYYRLETSLSLDQAVKIAEALR